MSARRGLRMLLAALLPLFAACSAITAPAPHRPAAEAGTVREATVERVVDGDTAIVRVGGARERVRFIGVDTPESTSRVEAYGREASAYTTRLMRPGATVWLEPDAEARDRYGRLLAYVWLAEPERGDEEEIRAHMLNARLLIDGMAQVMTVPPNVRYADLFLVLQREARAADAGLWS